MKESLCIVKNLDYSETRVLKLRPDSGGWKNGTAAKLLLFQGAVVQFPEKCSLKTMCHSTSCDPESEETPLQHLPAAMKLCPST